MVQCKSKARWELESDRCIFRFHGWQSFIKEGAQCSEGASHVDISGIAFHLMQKAMDKRVWHVQGKTGHLVLLELTDPNGGRAGSP